MMEQADIYGKDGKDVLARWDRGEPIHTIEMGGLSPGYEQCIQIAAMEVLRACLDAGYETSKWEKGAPEWERDRDDIDRRIKDTVNELGLSGAQWGAAINLGTAFYMREPAELLSSVNDDRLIQASKDFPGGPKVEA